MDKPQRRVERRTYKVEYWDCGNGHHHMTAEVARRCMAKAKAAQPHRKRTSLEIKALAERYLAGESFATLAAELKLGRYRAYQMIDIWAYDVMSRGKDYREMDEYRALRIRERLRLAIAAEDDKEARTMLAPGQSFGTAKAYLEAIART